MIQSLYFALMALGIILGVTLLFLWSTYNHFIRSRNQLKTDYSDVEIQLKRRADLIGQLVDKVKEYATHEKTTFTNVALARSAVDNSKTVKDAAGADNMLTSSLRSLFAVVEAHPELKANQGYQDLTNNLKQTEDDIAEHREVYNQTAKHYNNTVQTFPNVLAASLFGFTEADYFNQAK